MKIGNDIIKNIIPMQMHFNKIIQFSRQLKAGNRQREFNFKKLKNTDDEQFTVNVSDERGDRIVFSMKKEEDKWHISPAQLLPTWILQSEVKLHEVIEEELAQTN
mgnify:CR=1 FL=1